MFFPLHPYFFSVHPANCKEILKHRIHSAIGQGAFALSEKKGTQLASKSVIYSSVRIYITFQNSHKNSRSDFQCRFFLGGRKRVYPYGVLIRLNAQGANAFYNRARYLQPKSSQSATAIVPIVIISIN